MNRFLQATTRAGSALFVALLLSTSGRTACAAPGGQSAEAQSNLAAGESGAYIECTTPDGRVEVLRPNEPSLSSAALLRDRMLSCPLQEGLTTFVITLPNTVVLDRFTFVNENAAAAGELKISVSNYQLPATSPKWVEVDGSVNFSRKRLFNLSMLGVEARYVKLAFTVENGSRIGALGLYGDEPADRFARYRNANLQFGWTEAAPAEDEPRSPRRPE